MRPVSHQLRVVSHVSAVVAHLVCLICRPSSSIQPVHNQSTWGVERKHTDSRKQEKRCNQFCFDSFDLEYGQVVGRLLHLSLVELGASVGVETARGLYRGTDWSPRRIQMVDPTNVYAYLRAGNTDIQPRRQVFFEEEVR